MIRTVIFDIGNVLAGFAWRSYFEGLGFEEALTERLCRATVLSDDWKEYDRGCKTEKEMLQLFCENDPDLSDIIRQSLESMEGMMIRYDYAIPWIRELKQKGYQVLVLSNFSGKALRDCWHKLDFLPFVDGGILSFQDKLIKPMPEIYSLILDRYHLKAEECVFMDDVQENVDGALQAGIHAFRFENEKQARRALKELGVE